MIIAVTGKGGVGKTTLSALLTSRLIAGGRSPVLAVDADPNSCFDSILGVRAEKTVGSIREEARDSAAKALGAGIAKQDFLEMKISECLVESERFDLIAMGRPEGPGCYCYANNVIKEIIRRLSGSYPYVILDNEAGLENISRRIVRKIDLLLLVSDSSKNGLQTIRRLYKLAKEMKIEYGKLAIFINRINGGTVQEEALKLKEESSADFLVYLPFNSEIASISENGGDIFSLSRDNEVFKHIDDFISNLLPRS